MTNQKYVVLTHNNTLGGTGVRIVDIQVEGDDVTLTAEHNGQLKLSLKKCAGCIMATTLGDAKVGTVVNLEVDVMAKYAERLLAAQLEQVGASAGGSSTPAPETGPDRKEGR